MCYIKRRKPPVKQVEKVETKDQPTLRTTLPVSYIGGKSRTATTPTPTARYWSLRRPLGTPSFSRISSSRKILCDSSCQTRLSFWSDVTAASRTFPKSKTVPSRYVTRKGLQLKPLLVPSYSSQSQSLSTVTSFKHRQLSSSSRPVTSRSLATLATAASLGHADLMTPKKVAAPSVASTAPQHRPLKIPPQVGSSKTVSPRTVMAAKQKMVAARLMIASTQHLKAPSRQATRDVTMPRLMTLDSNAGTTPTTGGQKTTSRSSTSQRQQFFSPRSVSSRGPLTAPRSPRTSPTPKPVSTPLSVVSSGSKITSGSAASATSQRQVSPRSPDQRQVSPRSPDQRQVSPRSPSQRQVSPRSSDNSEMQTPRSALSSSCTASPRISHSSLRAPTARSATSRSFTPHSATSRASFTSRSSTTSYRTLSPHSSAAPLMVITSPSVTCNVMSNSMSSAIARLSSLHSAQPPTSVRTSSALQMALLLSCIHRGKQMETERQRAIAMERKRIRSENSMSDSWSRSTEDVVEISDGMMTTVTPRAIWTR